MFRNHAVTVGVIFTDEDNYTKFEETVDSIFRQRFFDIRLVLIDNSGKDYLYVDPKENTNIDKLKTKSTGFSFLRKFQDLFNSERDVIFLVSNGNQVCSIASNWNKIVAASDSPVTIICNDDIILNKYYDKIIYDNVMGNNADGGRQCDVCSFPEIFPHPELLAKDWNTENTKCKLSGGRGYADEPFVEGFNGCCFGVRTDVFKEVTKLQDKLYDERGECQQGHPFDMRYKLACYEDLDFYKVATDNLHSLFRISYESFVFHYGASTRNGRVVSALQNTETKGMYHIHYNKEVFKDKWQMNDEQLEEFESQLYKGWNDPEKMHSVLRDYEEENKNESGDT